MSLVLRTGPPPAAAAGARRGRRRHDRAYAIGGACLGLLLLCGVPVPSALRCDQLAAERAALEEKLAALKAEEQEVAEWEGGPKRESRAVHSLFRRWFSRDLRLLETRNHVLRVARVLRLELTDLSVTEEDLGGDTGSPTGAQVLGSAGGEAVAAVMGAAAGPKGLALPARAERIRMDGEGKFVHVLLLCGMLPASFWDRPNCAQTHLWDRPR
jgi:hypothetical protein